MLKKLFATALLLAFTVSANATPIKTGINGSFGLFGDAKTTIDKDGYISQIFFIENLLVGSPKGDFNGPLTRFQLIDNITNPIKIFRESDGSYSGGFSFKVGDFSFVSEEYVLNLISGANNNASVDLEVLGTLSAAGKEDTSAQFLFSSQGLTFGKTVESSFSITVTSPAPAPISEPGTLAIFGLALVGFAATRKKKSA